MSGARAWLLPAAWAALALTPAAAQQPGARADLEGLMAQLAQRRHGHVTYMEQDFIGTLTRPLSSSGELLYEAPAHLEKRTLRPRAETLVADGGTITDIRGRHTHVLSLQDYPQVVPLIDSIRSTLAGDLPALERLFTVTWQGSIGAWRLLLAPREATMSGTVREIEIRGIGARIRSVEIRQPDGDRSLMVLGDELPG